VELKGASFVKVRPCDIGYVDDVDPDAGELTARFDGRSVTYGFGELDTLVPAYAATIHKSQGSEYPAVVIPVMTQHYTMLQRNLLYTGVTRGKGLVVLVGQRKAVAIAVRKCVGAAALVEAEGMVGCYGDSSAGRRSEEIAHFCNDAARKVSCGRHLQSGLCRGSSQKEQGVSCDG
jgi:exodeoxyribonuclease V alpha subunit